MSKEKLFNEYAMMTSQITTYSADENGLPIFTFTAVIPTNGVNKKVRYTCVAVEE